MIRSNVMNALIPYVSSSSKRALRATSSSIRRHVPEQYRRTLKISDNEVLFKALSNVLSDNNIPLKNKRKLYKINSLVTKLPIFKKSVKVFHTKENFEKALQDQKQKVVLDHFVVLYQQNWVKKQWAMWYALHAHYAFVNGQHAFSKLMLVRAFNHVTNNLPDAAYFKLANVLGYPNWHNPQSLIDFYHFFKHLPITDLKKLWWIIQT